MLRLTALLNVCYCTASLSAAGTASMLLQEMVQSCNPSSFTKEHRSDDMN